MVRLLKQADRFAALLESGEVKNRAELARRFDISAMWVTDIMRLRKLHPAIQAAIRRLPEGTPRGVVSERKLRVVAELPFDEQLRQARRFLPGLSTS